MMVDKVDRKTRSRMMSAIRSKDTSLELIVRRALHKRGYRYRLHSRKLPGSPDLVLSKYKAVIEISGCFWHGHECRSYKKPKTNVEYWEEKIKYNLNRDKNKITLLNQMGWKVLVVWGCAIKGKNRLSEKDLIDQVVEWIVKGKGNKFISGKFKFLSKI